MSPTRWPWCPECGGCGYVDEFSPAAFRYDFTAGRTQTCRACAGSGAPPRPTRIPRERWPWWLLALFFGTVGGVVAAALFFASEGHGLWR